MYNLDLFLENKNKKNNVFKVIVQALTNKLQPYEVSDTQILQEDSRESTSFEKQ